MTAASVARPRRGGVLAMLRSERVLLGLAGFLSVLVLWELAVQLGFLRRAILSSPSLMLQLAIRDFGSGRLADDIRVSLTEFGLGYGAALLTGIPLGMALGFNRRLHAFVNPWLGAIYATPTIALLPIIVIFFGIGMESKVIVVWMEAFVVITVSVLTGTGSIEDRYLNIAYSFKASRWFAFRTVAWPSVIPFMLAGARLGVGRALVGVIVAELLASNAGIGYYITLAGSTLNITGVMLGVVLIGLFGVVSGEAIRRLERRFEAWRPEIN